MKSRSKNNSQGALDLIEEAIHLVRRAPISIWLSYFIGSGPFVLGLLYFWSDMAMSSFAARHCAEAAFGMSILYLWMKCWQSVYAIRLKCYAANEMSPIFSAKRIFRIFIQQAVLQPYSLIAIPLSFLAFIPFGWVYVFYHNLSITGGGEETDIKKVRSQAWGLAGLWPGQNHRLIAVFSLFVPIVFLNLRAMMLVIPFLIRTLLGVETPFSLSGEHLLNTTFAAVVGGITYLCVNPLIKAVYVLRCFYGESVQSGADLTAQLKSIQPRKTVSAALIAIAIFSLFDLSSLSFATEAKQTTVSSKELNETIGKVIQEREYQWRLPREKDTSNDISRSVALEFLEGFYRWFLKWYNRIQDWFDSFLSDSKTKGGSDSHSGFGASKKLWYSLLAVVVVVFLAAVLVIWKKKKAKKAAVLAEPIAFLPNVRDESVLADQLPEEEWQIMARDFLTRGELRLALRALFLATLAGLSRRKLISIAKFKSNLDYQRELDRRAHSRKELQQLFSENVSQFERAWYGMHEVNEDLLSRFGVNHNRMITLAQE
jgi:hypothetical protein